MKNGRLKFCVPFFQHSINPSFNFWMSDSIHSKDVKSYDSLFSVFQRAWSRWHTSRQKRFRKLFSANLTFLISVQATLPGFAWEISSIEIRSINVFLYYYGIIWFCFELLYNHIDELKRKLEIIQKFQNIFSLTCDLSHPLCSFSLKSTQLTGPTLIWTILT